MEEEKEWIFEGIVRRASSELEIENLHNLPRLVRRLRVLSRREPVMLELCRATIWAESLQERFRVRAVLDVNGDIWLIGGPVFEGVMNECGVWGRRRRVGGEGEDEERWEEGSWIEL